MKEPIWQFEHKERSIRYPEDDVMKILVVDDSQGVRELLRQYLPASVNEVFECNDGDQAYELYHMHRPDWVLMDWEMPRVDGITATRQIIADYPNANICMVTAFEDEDLKKEAFEAGAEEFVVKDNLNELKTILTRET